MNGANADDSAKIIRRDIKIRNRNIGPSHHFFEVLKKYQNSLKILSRSLSAISCNIFQSGYFATEFQSHEACILNSANNPGSS